MVRDRPGRYKIPMMRMFRGELTKTANVRAYRTKEWETFLATYVV